VYAALVLAGHLIHFEYFLRVRNIPQCE
jgi:hypothetical protein